jgi:hypothetical protein
MPSPKKKGYIHSTYVMQHRGLSSRHTRITQEWAERMHGVTREDLVRRSFPLRAELTLVPFARRTSSVARVRRALPGHRIDRGARQAPSFRGKDSADGETVLHLQSGVCIGSAQQEPPRGFVKTNQVLASVNGPHNPGYIRWGVSLVPAS